MSLVYTIPTKFTAKDGVSPVLKGMERNLLGFVDHANAGIARQERLFRKLTPHLGHATRQLLDYASAGAVLGGIAFSGKAIVDYETAIQSLQAVTGVSNEELGVFKGEIKSLATESKKSATDVAGSFEVIGSAMSQYLTDPKALSMISSAGITLAKASRQELVPTLENLTSIMNQFDLKANQATETINRLTAGEIVGALRTSQVAEALQEFGAGAYAANVNLSESVALVEALAKQMKTDKIGVGARNILTVLDSAKGLDRKARRDLRRSGVDLNFLMDKTQTLGARLKELSKIQGNSTVITSVFGKENKTAAQVIFNQLGTYNAYLEKIKVTNEAQHQAETNSKTLAMTVDRLKNTWLNYITTSDKTAAGLEKIKKGIGLVADNMDTIVSVGVNVIKFFALWKAAIVAQKVVTTGLSVALGINNFVTGASIGLLESDALAQRVSMIAKTANAIATRGLTANILAMNAAMAANPVMTIVSGLALLTTGIYLLSQREKGLREEYQKKLDLDTVGNIKKETDAVDALVKKYEKLHFTTQQAHALAIRSEKVNIDFQRKKVEAQITSTQQQLSAEKSKLYLADLFAGGGAPEVGKRAELAAQLEALQGKGKGLADRSVGVAEKAQAYMGAGIIDKSDLGGAFNTEKTGTGTSGGANPYGIGKNNAPTAPLSAADIYLMQVAEKLNKAAGKLSDAAGKNININVDGKRTTGTGIANPASY